MKSYKVTLTQKVEGELVLQADNKTDAKEIINDLIRDNKMQNLITDMDGDFINNENLECDGWEIDLVEEY